MPDEKNDITSVMDAAWNETMGESSELVEDFSHLGGEPPKELELATPVTVDTPPVTEEPVIIEEPAKVAEESTPITEPAQVQAPQHWSEADRNTFTSLAPEGQAFLLRRHKEMEADYTRKTQENAEAIRIGSTAIRNIDPTIQAELRAAGVSHDKFVENLIGFHRLSNQNPIEFVRQITAALNIDPATVFSSTQTPPGKTPAPQAVPDVIATRLQNLESYIKGEVQSKQESLRSGAQLTIQEFTSEKDAVGQPAHPHFERVRTVMARLMSVDPDMDIKTAYDVAVFRDPEIRADAVRSVTAPAGVIPSPTPVPLDKDKAARGAQAAMAAKSNVRGSGSPGSAAPAKPVRMSLSEALNAAAEEVGMK